MQSSLKKSAYGNFFLISNSKNWKTKRNLFLFCLENLIYYFMVIKKQQLAQ